MNKVKIVKIVRTIDPNTFTPIIGVMIDKNRESYHLKDLGDLSDKEFISEIVKDLKIRYDESLHQEIDEVFTNEFKSKMTVNEYQNKAIETAIYGEGSKIIYPTLGLAGEAGEVADKVKKVLRDNEGVFTDEKKLELAKEIGDVGWYMAALCRDIGYTLEEVLQMNLDKLASRKERNVIGGSGDNR